MILFYDTETTNLNLKGVPSDDPRQPDVVSLSAILDDEEGNTRRVMSVLCRDAKPSDAGALKIHGITKQTAERFGVPREAMMEMFMSMATSATILCAYNHFFDFKMAKIQCARLPEHGAGFREFLESRQELCMMEASADFLKGEGQRFIKLKDAYKTFFGTDLIGAHGSLEDARACRRIYYHLKKLDKLPNPVGVLVEKETPATGESAQVDF